MTTSKLNINGIRESLLKEGYTLLSDEYINNRTKLEYICPNNHTHRTDWKLWQQGKRCPKCNNKKNSIENIKDSLYIEGYTLLSDKYINNKSKLKYECDKGHLGTITWNDWVGGSRCGICSANKNSEERRNKMYLYIKNCLEDGGYVLLSNEYIDNKTKLKYICPEGHLCEICWNVWQRGHKCPTCSTNKKSKDNNDKNYIDVKNSFEAEGYVLISKEYKNSHSKLHYICPSGHTHSIAWYAWKYGKRCPYCSGNTKPTIECVEESFKLEGYTLLSKKYTNNKTKLEYVCPNTHKHSITWSDWKSGYRCPYCAGRGAITIENVIKYFDAERYTLLSKEYINNKTKLNYICSEGHTHSITWNDWVGGYRCPECASIKMSGPGHPNWKGGISFEPYCEVWKNQEYKRDIRNRDDNMCLNPYCDSPDADDLTIHHIDYDKKNCHPKNLITVCRSCNAKANSDREWHKSWYQSLLKNRYGGNDAEKQNKS